MKVSFLNVNNYLYIFSGKHQILKIFEADENEGKVVDQVDGMNKWMNKVEDDGHNYELNQF